MFIIWNREFWMCHCVKGKIWKRKKKHNNNIDSQTLCSNAKSYSFESINDKLGQWKKWIERRKKLFQVNETALLG